MQASHLPGGFSAKIDRAIEQIEALQREIREFGTETHPYSLCTEVYEQGRHYIFRLYPSWEMKTLLRWGAIIGEITHDLHSALDQLVWQSVAQAGITPQRWHHFPAYSREPDGGFQAWATRTDRKRNGPLCGAPVWLVDVAERCQPYNGGNTGALGLLRGFWLADKHKHLIPILLVAPQPALNLRKAKLIQRLPDRYEGGAHIIEVLVSPTGSDPHVDVEPRAPFDIAFAENVPVIEIFRQCAEVILTEIHSTE